MVMRGKVNKSLVPIVQVGLKDDVGDWIDISMLLDTGFDGEIMFKASLLDEYNPSTWPHRQLRTPEDVLASPEYWELMAPYKGELNWYGHPKEVGIRLVKDEALAEQPMAGLLGTKLLEFHLLTVDVVEGGFATVESSPPPPERRTAKWQPFRDKHFRTSAESPEDETLFLTHELLYGPLLPWAILDVPDSKGRFHSICFNVDTGSNQEIGLTSDLVSRLGLSATGKERRHTWGGMVEADQGEVEIFWDRKKRTVKWSCIPGSILPVIGMELLKGKRITAYFSSYRTVLQIRNIPRQPRSNSGFLHSIRGRISLYRMSSNPLSFFYTNEYLPQPVPSRAAPNSPAPTPCLPA